MADLIELSSRIIDDGVDEPANRITNELSELADGLAIVESFSHSVVVDSGDGLVAFDASHTRTGPAVVDAIRGWRSDPVTHLVYTTATPITSAGARPSPPPSGRRRWSATRTSAPGSIATTGRTPGTCR